MARYLIPVYNVADLTKKINRIINKGADVTYEVINYHVNVPTPRLGRGRSIECAEIEIAGEYRINGWVFVATIEHAQPENIIRVGDMRYANRIPERYRTAGRECEHCHIRRDRNDTYLVYNEDNDEWRQVGRTCLQGYTGGLDAEACAMLVDVYAQCNKLNRMIRNQDFDDEFMNNYSIDFSYSMEYIRPLAYRYVVDNGYTPGETGRAFARAVNAGEDLPAASNEEVQNVTDFLETAARDSDWGRNARAAWNKEVFESRDAGLITSAVQGYLRARDQQARINARQNDANNAYAGNVGDKVTFTISEVRVLYWRQGGSPYSYRSTSYPVYRMLGTDGKIYIWGCTQDIELVPGDEVTGTIKKLSEFRGERQTEVTRCKVKKAPEEPEPLDVEKASDDDLVAAYSGFDFGD